MEMTAPSQWQEPSILPTPGRDPGAEPGRPPPGEGQLPKPDVPLDITLSCCGKRLNAAQARRMMLLLVLGVLALLVVLVATAVSILTREPTKADGTLPIGGLSGGVGSRRTCAQQPCLNGGVCSEDSGCAGGFGCDCRGTGYVGETCALELDACYSFPCAHGGVCADRVSSDGYECSCAEGWDGENCVEEADECESSPCLNGGRCVDERGAYSCRCDSGYTGENCEGTPARACSRSEDDCNAKEGCRPAPGSGDTQAAQDACAAWASAGRPGTAASCRAISGCVYTAQSRGQCVGDGPGVHHCECNPGAHPSSPHASCPSRADRGWVWAGWSGETCATQSDRCVVAGAAAGGGSPSPCANGGSCVDMINDFECLCAAGFAGPTCALDVDECASDPCCGRGSIGCTDGADSYACQCGKTPPCPPPPRWTLPKPKRKPALRWLAAQVMASRE